MMPRVVLCVVVASLVALAAWPAAAQERFDLDGCISNGISVLDMVWCHEQAAAHDPTNITLHNRLSVAYHRSYLLTRAQEQMNRTFRLAIQTHKDLFNMSEQFSYSNILRTFHDNNVSETQEIATGVAKMLEMKHRVGEAHRVHYDYLMQIGHTRTAQEFHRRTGNIVAATEGDNRTSILFRIAETVPAILQLYTEHIMQAPVELSKDNQVRRFCGINITSSDNIKISDVMKNMMGCLEKFGNLTELVKTESEDALFERYSRLRFTHFHRLATLDALHPIRAAIKAFEGNPPEIRGDIFGRLPVHQAAAAGANNVLRYFVKTLGTPLDVKDRGTITPIILACSSPGYREQFMKSVKAGACDDINNDIFTEETDEVDETGTDGGWNKDKRKFMKTFTPMCDVDQRDSARMKHQDMIIAYLYSNRPLVLRGSFFPDGPAKGWHKDTFKADFGRMRVRQERTPVGERFGVPVVNVTTVADFIDALPPKQWANTYADEWNKDLWELANWQPENFQYKTETNNKPFASLNNNLPLIQIFSKEAQTAHAFRAQGTMFAVVFGVVEFTALPPKDAITTRSGQLPKKLADKAVTCILTTGDTLILPELWSVSFTTRTNGVMLERSITWSETYA